MSYGAAEDIQLEPFVGMSDWLLSSPDIDWAFQLREATRTKFVRHYRLSYEVAIKKGESFAKYALVVGALIGAVALLL